MERNENDVVAPGAKFAVRFAADAAGIQHARIYLDQVAALDERIQVLRRCERLAATGAIPNREHFRMVVAPIFEIKAHQARISCYRRGQVWFLLHGFTKKKDVWPPQELERAQRILTEHLARPG